MSTSKLRKVSADRFQHDDVLSQPVAGASSDTASRIAQLEGELESTQAALASEHARMQVLREQLDAREKDDAAVDAGHANSSFNIVMQLSSEREVALRERKAYKERAENAEAQVAELESDLSAAHASAKVNAERVQQLTARCDDLQRIETELRAKLAELEMQLTDRAGVPTLVGGDLERLAAGMFPKTIYALESLDHPGQVHKLTRPTNTVGRSHDNDIPLDSSSVSRFHARFVNKADGMWLSDLQSVNGCKVNGQRISGQLLSDGDLVIIGHCRFRFSALNEQPNPAS